jgi:CheY-like chemotaxis protein
LELKQWWWPWWEGVLSAQAEVVGNISEMGYESLLTDDPEEAVGVVQSGACRVILADVHLPGIHAYEFLERLLRVDPGLHVIIITKEYTLESALEAMRRGATDFLPKPLDRLRLKRALDGYRERAGGAGHTSAEPGEPTAPRGLQLFGDGGHPARQSTFWTCARSLYRRNGNASRIVRMRRWRDGFS